eukprot:g33257.t1
MAMLGALPPRPPPAPGGPPMPRELPPAGQRRLPDGRRPDHLWSVLHRREDSPAPRGRGDASPLQRRESRSLPSRPELEEPIQPLYPAQLPPLGWAAPPMEDWRDLKANALRPRLVSMDTGAEAKEWLERRLEASVTEQRDQISRRFGAFEQADKHFKDWVQREHEQLHSQLQQLRVSVQETGQQQQRLVGNLTAQSQKQDMRLQELEGQMAQSVAQVQGLMNAVSAGAMNAGNGGGTGEAAMGAAAVAASASANLEVLRQGLEREASARVALGAETAEQLKQLSDMVYELSNRQQQQQVSAQQHLQQNAAQDEKDQARVVQRVQALEPSVSSMREELEELRKLRPGESDDDLDKRQGQVGGMNGCGRLVVLACVMTIQACLELQRALEEERLERRNADDELRAERDRHLEQMREQAAEAKQELLEERLLKRLDEQVASERSKTREQIEAFIEEERSERLKAEAERLMSLQKRLQAHEELTTERLNEQRARWETEIETVRQKLEAQALRDKQDLQKDLQEFVQEERLVTNALTEEMTTLAGDMQSLADSWQKHQRATEQRLATEFAALAAQQAVSSAALTAQLGRSEEAQKQRLEHVSRDLQPPPTERPRMKAEVEQVSQELDKMNGEILKLIDDESAKVKESHSALESRIGTLEMAFTARTAALGEADAQLAQQLEEWSRLAAHEKEVAQRFDELKAASEADKASAAAARADDRKAQED